MQPTTEENTWVRLVRKTRRFPLLYGTPIIRSSDDRVVIRDGWLQWFAAAIMTGFAALLVYVVLFHHNDMEHFAIVLCLSFGGFFTWGAIWLFLRVNRMVWSTYDPYLSISEGVFPFVRKIDIAAEEAEVELSLETESRLYSASKKGYSILSLRRVGHEKEALRVAVSLVQEWLRPAFESLTEFFGGKGVDKTLVQVATQDQGTIVVSKAPIATGGANFRSMTLSFPSPNVALFRPSPGLRLFFLIFLAFGALGLVILLPVAVQSGALWAIFLVTGVGGLFAVLGALGLLGGIGYRQIIADREQEVLFVKAGVFGIRKWDSYPLSDIAGVQLCSRYVEGGENSLPYTTYELNLVLRHPEGKRIHVMSHARERRVRQDAQKFAQFIGKPVWDHT